MKFFRRTAGNALLLPQKERRNFGRAEPVAEKVNQKIKVTTTYNKNEQQDAKNNPEL